MWEDTTYSHTGKICISKMAILPKPTYRCNTIFIKIPMKVFAELEKHLEIHMEAQKTPNRQK
jgi:hypothetical protein